EYGKRRRKVSFEIREGPQVVVTAPYGADRDEIYSVLKTHGGWLATNYTIIEKSGIDGKAGLSVVYQGKTYNYTVKYLQRAVRYALKIHEDNSIEVTAPALASKEDVELFVKNAASFIHEKINDPDRIVARPMEFKDGGSVLVKGKEVQIKTIRSHIRKEPELTEGILTVTLPHQPEEDEDRIKWEISRFLQNLTFKEVNRYLPEYARVLRLSVPDIDIRFYKTCWGKCRPGRNQVIFNERLAMLPADLIEYIVAHEMCHFYHPNHGKEFYNTLNLIMPDADERKKRTNRYRINLIKYE
ncbi:MAG: M48 family metallopeptidase, partial [Methanogenium sp.]|nr:M48 family metallopeptidase [Methanogenium sp.]